jgi:hypothetical protein
VPAHDLAFPYRSEKKALKFRLVASARPVARVPQTAISPLSQQWF